MIWVAQLNADRLCVAISELRALPAGELFVAVDGYDEALLGRHHDGQAWAAPSDPAPEPRYVDLDRSDTRAAVEQLETLGLLGSGRASEILDAPVQALERP